MFSVVSVCHSVCPQGGSQCALLPVISLVSHRTHGTPMDIFELVHLRTPDPSIRPTPHPHGDQSGPGPSGPVRTCLLCSPYICRQADSCHSTAMSSYTHCFQDDFGFKDSLSDYMETV